MKSKNIIVLILILFALYFTMGFIFTYYLDTTNAMSLYFGADTNRVIIDLTIRSASHYRTTVHPLFVILFQPLIYLMSKIFQNKIICIILVQSIFSALSVTMTNILLKKITSNKIVSNLLTIIMALSFSQLMFSATIETYTFAQLFLVCLIFYTFIRQGEQLTKKDYIILIILGVLSVGITITNYLVYLFVILFICIFQDKKNNKEKIIDIILLSSIPALIAIALSEVQSVIFPDSRLFFKENLIAVLHRNSPEAAYIQSITMESIINQIRVVFGYTFFTPKIVQTTIETYPAIIFGKFYFFQKIIILLTIICILVLSITFVKRNIKKTKENLFLILLIILWILNFSIHCIYGNLEGFLYTLHYQFLFFLIIGYLLKDISKKYIKFFIIFAIIFLLTQLIFNTIGFATIYKIIERFTFNNSIPMVFYIIYILVCTLIIFILNIEKKWKFILIFLEILTIIFISVIISNNKIKTYINEDYKKDFEKYNNQIKELKEEFNVNTAFDSNEKIFFFGMGNRKKFLYKSGKLIDLEKNEIMYDFKVKKEMIIPNMYTVSLITKQAESIIISENEEEIYIKINDSKITLDSGTKINLPKFENNKYSEILKVLHQEVLFNIEDSTLKPNILVYESGWYRDGMMGAMVLKNTENIQLIKKWIDNVDDIYDRQNGGVEETDNLGELLYLLYVTNSNNDIKEEIIKEIKDITKKNQKNYISGYTDGQILSYYPTAIALYSLNKMNIDLGMELPLENDNYTNLTWFFDKERISNTIIDSMKYPYLGWANYHKNRVKQSLYICDNLYPISYEKEATYAKYNEMNNLLSNYRSISLAPTHVWSAAEMFLLLMEY